jgi:hypothetical protein
LLSFILFGQKESDQDAESQAVFNCSTSRLFIA